MISIENREAFARAEQKARQIKPRVRVIKFGEYAVDSSDPGHPPYTVKFSKSDTGHWLSSCTCVAHVGPEYLTEDQRSYRYMPKPCYHIVAGYSVHKVEVFKRQQQREQEHPLPRCECGKPGFACHEDRWYCGGCIEGAMRDGLVDLGELDEARQQAIEDEAENDAYREMLQLEKDRADLFG
jgi:ribosomal protein S27AE